MEISRVLSLHFHHLFAFVCWCSFFFSESHEWSETVNFVPFSIFSCKSNEKKPNPNWVGSCSYEGEFKRGHCCSLWGRRLTHKKAKQTSCSATLATQQPAHKEYTQRRAGGNRGVWECCTRSAPLWYIAALVHCILQVYSLSCCFLRFLSLVLRSEVVCPSLKLCLLWFCF
jgi:hypothetical protein